MNRFTRISVLTIALTPMAAQARENVLLIIADDMIAVSNSLNARRNALITREK